MATPDKFKISIGMVPDEDDPYADLFEGLTPEQMIELQAEIDAAEGK